MSLPVQNNLSELYTLFNVAVPGLLGPAAQFRRTYEGCVCAFGSVCLISVTSFLWLALGEQKRRE